MEKSIIVYDDSRCVGQDIKNIVGNKRFGEIIVKRKSIERRFLKALTKHVAADSVFVARQPSDFQSLRRELENTETNRRVIHIFSDFAVTDDEAFAIAVNKALYSELNVRFQTPDTAMLVFCQKDSYVRFLSQLLSHEENRAACVDAFDFARVDTTAFLNLGDSSQFLRYVTGSFDARFFNALSGDEYTVTKTSADKRKIKAEYTFYHLLPENMQRWFVLPFDYREDANGASYSMERYQMTDLAVRWVHGALTTQEFDALLRKVFYFINSRASRSVSPQEYRAAADALYLEKLRARLAQLKECAPYAALANSIATGTRYASVDAVFEQYYKMYAAEKDAPGAPVSVIGHGDLCFSNMLYNKETMTLRLIDPKGALTEPELWTDPLYDVAKLSHSICGLYDLFNSGMVDVELDDALRLSLHVEFDNAPYVEIFNRHLQENGISPRAVRLREASLFLSMLPLHIDHPKKVLGFLLNAIAILEELEQL